MCGGSNQAHPFAISSTNGAPGWIEIIEAKYVDAIMVRHRALLVKRINAANGAEIMSRYACVPLVEAELLRAGGDHQLVLMNSCHPPIFLAAERAIAGVNVSDVDIDSEPHRAAMAGAMIEGHGAVLVLFCRLQLHRNA